MENNNDFLPKGYDVPKGNANYMKFEKGENKFRILSKPIIGWEDWQDKKPIRFKMNNKPSQSVDPKKPLKHFWSFIVWNYKSESIQILEITQSGIQSSIKTLTQDAEWGSPYAYDIKVIRSGEGMETEYKVNPSPHKKVSQEIQDAYLAKPCNLEALFTGEDPFSVKESVAIDDLPLGF